MVALLFDNDGVLIDSHAFHWKSWQLLMEEGVPFSMTEEEFATGFGKRNDLILKELVPDSTLEQRSEWAQRKETLFRQCARGKITLLPGMEPFLRKVNAQQIPHIIASSTPVENLEMFLQDTVLGKYFDAFVSAEQVPHGKPAPDVFLEAAKRLGAEPHECIVFEDAPAGITAGRDAGCFVVALETTHGKESLQEAHLIVGEPRDLNLPEILTAFEVWRR